MWEIFEGQTLKPSSTFLSHGILLKNVFHLCEIVIKPNLCISTF